MLIRSRVSGFKNKVYQTLGGIWAMGDCVPKHNNILIILEGPEGRILRAGRNRTTTAGDLYYAQLAATTASVTPTNAFVNMHISTSPFDSGHPAAGTDSGDLPTIINDATSAPESGYPKANDSDTDNGGKGTNVVTWAYTWSKVDFSDASIEGICIGLTGKTTSDFGGSENDPLLNARNETAFAKTADDTLKIFVNHTFTGS